METAQEHSLPELELIINETHRLRMKWEYCAEIHPPYQYFIVQDKDGIKWDPYTEPTNLPEEFHWTDTEDVPNELLCESQGPDIHCQVVFEDKIIMDWGRAVKFCQSSYCWVDGEGTTYGIKKGHYSVGEGTEWVEFFYAHGRLFAENLQVRWNRKVCSQTGYPRGNILEKWLM